MIDVLISFAPNILRNHVVDSHNKYILVMRTVENDGFSPHRCLLMNSPKKVVPKLNRSRYFERGDARGLGIHELQEVSNCAVFSARVSTLQDNEERCLPCGEHQFLQFGDSCGELFELF